MGKDSTCVLFELQRKGSGGMSIKAAQINCQQETAPLSETGQKSNSMFAKYYNPHSFVLYYFISFISDRILSIS